MSMLVTRLILTVIILLVSYYGLHKVWTKPIDIVAILKKPSDIIPVRDIKPVERPWITIEKVDLQNGTVRVGTPLKIRIRFKNTGTLPARNVRNQCVAESMLAGQKPAFNYERWPSVSSAVLGVGVEMEANVSATSVSPLGQDGFDQLLKKEAFVYAHGHITYEDSSGNSHWTDFCYLLRVEPNGDYAFETFSEHNDLDTD